MAYPDNSIWIAIFPAMALMIYAIVCGSLKQTIAVGLVTGFAYYASQIPWMTVYLGPVPWLALSVLEAVIFSAGALAINRLWRRMLHHKAKNHFIVSAAMATVWVAREWLACNFPYGGFPWSRLALSQSNSPLANWAYWGGLSLVSWIVAFTSVLVMLTWQTKLRPAHWSNSPVAATLVLIFLIPQMTNLSLAPTSKSINVAAVQGNANAGLFANPVPGSILQNHLAASHQLLDSTSKPDVVIWPENAADTNPLSGGTAKNLVSNFVNQVGAPLIFGTITTRGNDIFNSSILWLPNVGAVDWYDKKRPVAFGEFVPDREFFHALAPELIDLIPRGYSFGTRDGIFDFKTKAGNQTKLGTMICFEVAVDDITRDLVRQGAQVLVVQTNNSDFGTTNESTQQFAIAKMRAIESGRAVVNISTVGLSGVILPSGEVVDTLTPYQPGVMRDLVPLNNTLTPAMQFGTYVEMANNFAAMGVLIFLVARRRGKNVE